MSKKPDKADKEDHDEEQQQQQQQPEQIPAAAGKKENRSGLHFSFEAHQYFSVPLDPRDPYAISKYGSQVRERKIDRCLKQLQDALQMSKWVRAFYLFHI